MRSLLYSLLSLATLATTLAEATPTSKPKDDWDEPAPDTVFNGQAVPPMKELDSVHIESDISKGIWYAYKLSINNMNPANIPTG